MSITDPLYGVDAHSDYQAGLEWDAVRNAGYRYAFIKATEGDYLIPTGTKRFYRLAADALPFVGLYHFLVEGPSGAAQARYFHNFARDVVGRDDLAGCLVAVDFETYGARSPTNETLKAYIASLRERIGKHAIILYSSKSYWDSGFPSGGFYQYGADVGWEARYGDMEPHRWPQAYYKDLLRWDVAWDGFGDAAPYFWQFTSSGYVAGHWMDVNAFRGNRTTLSNLSSASGPSSLPSYIDRPLEYLERCVGGPYTPWISGNFCGSDGPPAWARNTPPAPAYMVRTDGTFCAALANLATRVNDLNVLSSTPDWWCGGVAWWGQYLKQKGVLKEFSPDKNYEPGTLFLRRYTGASIADQGHMAIKGRHGRLLQADFFGDSKDGVNENRTLDETQALLRRFDTGGFEFYVEPEGWLK